MSCLLLALVGTQQASSSAFSLLLLLHKRRQRRDNASGKKQNTSIAAGGRKALFVGRTATATSCVDGGGRGITMVDGYLEVNNSGHDSGRRMIRRREDRLECSGGGGGGERGEDRSYGIAYKYFCSDAARTERRSASNENDDDEKTQQSSPLVAVLFCGGYRSSMTSGRKAVALEEHCRSAHNLEFCALDYRGHGGSKLLSSTTNDENDGEDLFLRCTMSYWIQDTVDVIDHVVMSSSSSSQLPVPPHDNNDDVRRRKRVRLVLVGSSMGAWIAVHVAAALRPVAGMVLIAAAPDFAEDVYKKWKTIHAGQERLHRASNDDDDDAVIYLPSQYDGGRLYPSTRKLIADARDKWLLLDKEKIVLPRTCSAVRLLHGLHDEDVPWQKSQRLAELMTADGGCENVQLTLIEDGDHRLSEPRHLDAILAALDSVVDSVAASSASGAIVLK